MSDPLVVRVKAASPHGHWDVEDIAVLIHDAQTLAAEVARLRAENEQLIIACRSARNHAARRADQVESEAEARVGRTMSRLMIDMVTANRRLNAYRRWVADIETLLADTGDFITAIEVHHLKPERDALLERIDALEAIDHPAPTGDQPS